MYRFIHRSKGRTLLFISGIEGYQSVYDPTCKSSRMNRSFTLAESVHRESSYKKYVLGVLGLKTFDLNVFN